MNDNVMHPAHYCDGDIEVIDYIKDKLPPEGFRDYCKGNVIKYISRAGKKGDAKEDLMKAAVYLSWAIDPSKDPAKEDGEDEKLKSEIGGLKIENAKLKAQIDNFKSEIRELKIINDELMMKNTELKLEISEVEHPVPPEDSKGKKVIDHGKIVACFKGGRSVSWIADEMKISPQTVYNHLQKEGLWEPKEKK